MVEMLDYTYIRFIKYVENDLSVSYQIRQCYRLPSPTI